MLDMKFRVSVKNMEAMNIEYNKEVANSHVILELKEFIRRNLIYDIGTYLKEEKISAVVMKKKKNSITESVNMSSSFLEILDIEISPREVRLPLSDYRLLISNVFESDLEFLLK